MNKKKQSILDDYIKFRRLKNKTRKIKDIEFQVKQFLSYSPKPLDNYTEKTLLDYLDKINKKYSVQTMNFIKSSILKNFIKYHFEDWSSRFRNLDLICKTEKATSKYKSDDMLSEQDFEKLIQKEESTFWKAYFLTLFYGCCRPIEVCELKWKDLEFEEEGAFFTITSNKNKETFLKFVPEKVSFYLKKLQNNDSEYIFVNKKTKQPIGVKGAYWKIRKLSKEVLGKEIDLYTLRHSIATINYNKEGIKDDHIARQMGHTKSMKGKYVHNNKEKLKEQAKKIYINPELTPEEKNELKKVKEELQELKKQMDEIALEILDASGEDLYKKVELLTKQVDKLKSQSDEGLEEEITEEELDREYKALKKKVSRR